MLRSSEKVKLQPVSSPDWFSVVVQLMVDPGPITEELDNT